jgi:hypothetical protein
MHAPTLLDRATARLKDLGLEVVLRKPARAPEAGRGGAHMRVGKGKHAATWLVEAKRGVTPGTLGATLAQLRQMTLEGKHPAMLVADYLTPQVAEALHARQQPFADAVGNAYLKAPGLFVYVTGRKPGVGEATVAKGDQALTNAGLKILFALICDPTLADAPYRTIAAAANVALGALPPVLAELRKKRHLLGTAKRRRLNGTKRLLDEWALDYARKLRPTTLLATYTTPNFDRWRDWQLGDIPARWGGEPAAQILVRHLEPGILTVYAPQRVTRLNAEQRMVAAGPTDAGRLVEIRKPFWGDTLRNDANPATVPPAVVYADLLATGDGRCIETAQLVHEAYLARLFPAK